MRRVVKGVKSVKGAIACPLPSRDLLISSSPYLLSSVYCLLSSVFSLLPRAILPRNRAVINGAPPTKRSAGLNQSLNRVIWENMNRRNAHFLCLVIVAAAAAAHAAGYQGPAAVAASRDGRTLLRCQRRRAERRLDRDGQRQGRPQGRYARPTGRVGPQCRWLAAVRCVRRAEKPSLDARHQERRSARDLAGRPHGREPGPQPRRQATLCRQSFR